MTYKYVEAKPFSESYKELPTLVFLDYESLFWSFYNLHGETPNLDGFYDELKKRGKLADKIKVFGDFSKEEIRDELTKIRALTNNITNCETPNNAGNKDYTDFIMLDHIYQAIIAQPHIEQYVLITGDSHFYSVATFIRTIVDKIVGVYGVSKSLGSQLINCATWAYEITPQNTNENVCIKEVLETIRQTELKKINPTFRKTVEITVNRSGHSQTKCSSVLSKLISDGYILQKDFLINEETPIRILVADWELINKHRLTA